MKITFLYLTILKLKTKAIFYIVIQNINTKVLFLVLFCSFFAKCRKENYVVLIQLFLHKKYEENFNWSMKSLQTFRQSGLRFFFYDWRQYCYLRISTCKETKSDSLLWFYKYESCRLSFPECSTNSTQKNSLYRLKWRGAGQLHWSVWIW